jgi:hypothetical protein
VQRATADIAERELSKHYRSYPPRSSLLCCQRLAKGWCAQGDDFRTFLNDFAACLVQIELPAGLDL